MSAFTEQETQINDVDVLKESLKEVGVKEVQHHQTAVPLEGYRGDKREDKAEVVIPRRAVGSMSNDIGFKKQSDGTYTAIISQYDKGRYNEKWMTGLKKVYAEKKAKKIAKTAGLAFIGKKVNEDGSFKLQFVHQTI